MSVANIAGIGLTAINLLVKVGASKEIGGIEFDAFMKETQTITTDITEFPVEDGSIIADHSIIKPRTLQIRAVVSNTPIRFLGGLTNALDNISNLTADKDSISKASKRAWQDLIDILEVRELLTISTELSVYENMVLHTLTATSDKDTGDILAVDMSFKEILTVTTQERKLSPTEVEAAEKDRAEDVVDKGFVEATETPNQSFLSSLVGG